MAQCVELLFEGVTFSSLGQGGRRIVDNFLLRLSKFSNLKYGATLFQN